MSLASLHEAPVRLLREAQFDVSAPALLGGQPQRPHERADPLHPEYRRLACRTGGGAGAAPVHVRGCRADFRLLPEISPADLFARDRKGPPSLSAAADRT